MGALALAGSSGIGYAVAVDDGAVPLIVSAAWIGLIASVAAISLACRQLAMPLPVKIAIALLTAVAFWLNCWTLYSAVNQVQTFELCSPGPCPEVVAEAQRSATGIAITVALALLLAVLSFIYRHRDASALDAIAVFVSGIPIVNGPALALLALRTLRARARDDVDPPDILTTS